MVGMCVLNACGVQMFGSVSSILRVDVDDVVTERDCNTVCSATSSCFGKTMVIYVINVKTVV